MTTAELRTDAARAPRFSAVASRRASGALSLVLAVTVACAGSSTNGAASFDDSDPGAVRYRLLLRENPVDPGGAFRCYGSCQSQTTPVGYLQCLQECPGFEITRGMRCSKREVPPIAACFTARELPADQEIDPGFVVLTVIANVAVVIALASLCSSSPTQCYVSPTVGPNAPGSL